jgi:hypothetical protein
MGVLIVNTTAALRRLEHILPRLTGEKALLDEATAIIRGMIDAQAPTVVWWNQYGPDRPLSPVNRRLVDFVILNGEATKKELAAHLGVDEDSAYRYVARADQQLLDRGGKATISWDGSGVARTATTSIVVTAHEIGQSCPRIAR